MDFIGNIITKIRNAQAVGKSTVETVYSRVVFEIAKILERTGYLTSVEVIERGGQKVLKLQLKYVAAVPAVRGVKRFSRPGLRYYVQAAELSKKAGEAGVYIISTPKGLMTDAEARKQNVGGELMCKVW